MNKFLLSIAIILFLGAGIYGLYSWYLDTQLEGDEYENQAKQIQVVPTGAEQNISGKNIPQIVVAAPVKKDTDKDGLDDEKEVEYSTNINKKDTDEDGLSDFEEIQLYDTDPLNSDTDGDGFSDGVEINSRYNPKGEGQLLDLEKELSQ